jgi:hypothetical protein
LEGGGEGEGSKFTHPRIIPWTDLFPIKVATCTMYLQCSVHPQSTQNCNGHFLAYIPSRWKNYPRLQLYPFMYCTMCVHQSPLLKQNVFPAEFGISAGWNPEDLVWKNKKVPLRNLIGILGQLDNLKYWNFSLWQKNKSFIS